MKLICVNGICHQHQTNSVDVSRRLLRLLVPLTNELSADASSIPTCILLVPWLVHLLVGCHVLWIGILMWQMRVLHDLINCKMLMHSTRRKPRAVGVVSHTLRLWAVALRLPLHCTHHRMDGAKLLLLRCTRKFISHLMDSIKSISGSCRMHAPRYENKYSTRFRRSLWVSCWELNIRDVRNEAVNDERRAIIIQRRSDSFYMSNSVHCGDNFRLSFHKLYTWKGAWGWAALMLAGWLSWNWLIGIVATLLWRNLSVFCC